MCEDGVLALVYEGQKSKSVPADLMKPVSHCIDKKPRTPTLLLVQSMSRILTMVNAIKISVVAQANCLPGLSETMDGLESTIKSACGHSARVIKVGSLGLLLARIDSLMVEDLRFFGWSLMVNDALGPIELVTEVCDLRVSV